jgi:5-formyltetrahydrofolate cyclo-ligase
MKKLPDQHIFKSELRTELRQRRALLDDIHRNILDTAINTHLVNYARQEKVKTVAAYLAFDGEPDLGQALAELENEGVALALPVVHKIPGRNTISFHLWTADDALEPNRYGILEPVNTPEVPLVMIDLMLIPLVGWDRAGNRLGMGASYYDRALQPLARQQRPVRTGVAYSAQETARIPVDPWDVPLHAMLTEHGWFTCDA